MTHCTRSWSCLYGRGACIGFSFFFFTALAISRSLAAFPLGVAGSSAALPNTTVGYLLSMNRDEKAQRPVGGLANHTYLKGKSHWWFRSAATALPGIMKGSLGTRSQKGNRPKHAVKVIETCNVPAAETRAALRSSILLLSLKDLTVVQPASWWTPSNTLELAIFVATLLLLALVWARVLQRKVEAQTGVLLARLQRIAALEERFRELFDNANDMVFTCGLRGQFTSLNRAGERITGYSRDVIVGKSLADLVAPESAGLAEKLVNAEDAERNSEAREIKILTSSGASVPLEVKTRIVYSEGIAIGIQGVGRDITERKRAEESLARERNLLRALVDTLPDFVYAKDIQSRFLLANRQVAQAMGAESPEELLGETDYDYYARELADKFRDDEHEVLEIGRAHV